MLRVGCGGGRLGVLRVARCELHSPAAAARRAAGARHPRAPRLSGAPLPFTRCLATSAGPPPPAKEPEPAEPSFREVMGVLAKHVWPKGDMELRTRVVASLTFLVGAKVLNVQVPMIFKEAIDALNESCTVISSPELVVR